MTPEGSFSSFRERVLATRVLIVGDVMLDRYWFGDVERISPEAPVPVVKISRTEERPGGAANVAGKLADYDRLLADCDLVILSDYGKGGLAHIATMIERAKGAGKRVLVDPKGDDWAKYRGATIITPNRAELRQVIGRWTDEADLVHRVQRLIADLAIDALLVTRSEEGMSLFTPTAAEHIPAQAREVFDVSGAGDTVIATLGVLLGAGADLSSAVRIANEAAGIVVGKLGTAVVTPDELG